MMCLRKSQCQALSHYPFNAWWDFKCVGLSRAKCFSSHRHLLLCCHRVSAQLATRWQILSQYTVCVASRWLHQLVPHSEGRPVHSQSFCRPAIRWRCHSLPHWSLWRTLESHLVSHGMEGHQACRLYSHCWHSRTWKEEHPLVASGCLHGFHHRRLLFLH